MFISTSSCVWHEFRRELSSRIRRTPGDMQIVGEDWHANTTCMAEPPYGGDTLFANEYLAYEALSDGMKAPLSRLMAVNSDTTIAGPLAACNKHRTIEVREDAGWRETVSEHPVVRTHLETGRKALFVNKFYTKCFSGLCR